MFLRHLIFTLLITLKITACTSLQPLDAQLAQQLLLDSWQLDQHVTWELDWATAPLGGPLTVETWRAGERYRFEILEAPAPALIGETLIFNGQKAWQYQRFAPPAAFRPSTATLSPVSDAFDLITRLLNTAPQTANQESTQVNFNQAQKITAMYGDDDFFILWQDIKTGLPLRINFKVSGHYVKLNARKFELLLDPPQNLFEAGEWLQ